MRSSTAVVEQLLVYTPPGGLPLAPAETIFSPAASQEHWLLTEWNRATAPAPPPAPRERPGASARVEFDRD